MNNNNDIVGTTKGTSTLTRARFGPGMLLQHGDLEQLNNYTRDLSRLLFQSFFGCGVICGLTVAGTEECGRLKVTVTPGVALTCVGDPVYVPEVQSVFTKQDFDPGKASRVWVVLCGTTKCCAPRVTTCSSDDDEATSDCTREKDAFEIRLLYLDTDKDTGNGTEYKLPECVCGCPNAPLPSAAIDRAYPEAVPENACKCVDPEKNSCYSAHYAGTCGCNCDECSNCDCKCVILARLYKKQGSQEPWMEDHSVRRFIRPVLMRDPQVEIEENNRKTASALAAMATPAVAAVPTTTATTPAVAERRTAPTPKVRKRTSR
jgi:hypothetical protein